MGSYIRGLIVLIIVLFLVTFGIKNSEPVRVDYYSNFLDFELPLYGLIFISLVIGLLAGMCTGLQSRLALKRTVKNLQKENKALTERLEGATESGSPSYAGEGEAEE